MYCQKCGAQLNESSRVCPQCNATVYSTYAGPLGNPVPVLVWGVVGLSTALTFYFSLLGVIFSIVGLVKSNRYNEFTNSADSNMARIGRRLSIAGIIVGGILTTVLLVLLVLLVVNDGRL